MIGNEDQAATESKDGEVLIQLPSDTEISNTHKANDEHHTNKTAIIKYSTLKTQLKFLIDSFNSV